MHNALDILKIYIVYSTLYLTLIIPPYIYTLIPRPYDGGRAGYCIAFSGDSPHHDAPGQ